MQGKTVLITGANTGIGEVTARELARMGATVLASGRDRHKLEKAVSAMRAATGNQAIHPLVADLAVMDQVIALAEDVAARTDRLDVLINNAGVILGERRETPDGLETTFAVNHLAPYLLTDRLQPLLLRAAPSRIVTVSSGWHTAVDGLDFDDLQSREQYDGKVAYQRSKLANILFTRALARRLQGTGVTANSLHPGVVRTRFGQDGDMRGALAFLFKLARPFFIGPEKGARTSIYLASSAEVEGVSGQYFVKCRPETPSRAALDDTAAERLWEESRRLLSRWLTGTAGRGSPYTPIGHASSVV